MDNIQNIWPLLVPIAVIQLLLQIFAIVNLVRRRKVRFNNKWIWAVIIIFGNMLGAIIYFVARGDDE